MTGHTHSTQDTTRGTAPLPETDFLLYFGDVSRNWKSMAALGAIATALGVLGLVATVALTLATVMIFGILLILGGAAQAVHTTRCRGWKSATLHGVIAALYIAAGAAAVIDPADASAFLTLLIATALLAVGVLRLGIGWQMRGQRSRVWPLIAGAIAVVLGLMILAQWPASGLWVIGLFISIELIVQGWSLLTVALAARSAGQGA